jgi:hypothetical protein
MVFVNICTGIDWWVFVNVCHLEYSLVVDKVGDYLPASTFLSPVQPCASGLLGASAMLAAQVRSSFV